MKKMKIDIGRRYIKLYTEDNLSMPNLYVNLFKNIIKDKYTVYNILFNPKHKNKKWYKPTITEEEYATYNRIKNNEFRFPRFNFNVLIKSMKDYGYDFSLFTKQESKVIEGQKINFSIKNNFKPRDYQIPLIDYLVKEDYPNKLINLQTGKGKTFIALSALSKIGTKTAIIILPRYIDKWVEDIKNLTNVKNNEILLIKGSNSLKSLMNMTKKELKPYKFFIISNRTLLSCIKEYEYSDNICNYYTYSKSPEELFYHLEIGNILIDEIHQHFNGCFKISLYSNVKTFIGLSATLENLDPKKVEQYYVLFPENHRCIEIEKDKYVDVKSVYYKIDDNILINYEQRGLGTYSHVEYEISIMKNERLLQDYMEMIKHFIEKGFISRYSKNDKCIIFVSTVKFATILTDYLKSVYENMDVRRYVEKDDYENIINADIRVTTLGSGGTAIDIPQLTTAIQTIAVNSIQANKQALGRLRKLKDKDVYYYYLNNMNIKTHMSYDVNKYSQFKSVVKDIQKITYSKILGSNRTLIKTFL